MKKRTGEYTMEGEEEEKKRALKYFIYVPGFGFIFLFPPVRVTLTKRRVYRILFLARPLGVFFFSWGSTFGVWDLTLPARARDP